MIRPCALAVITTFALTLFTSQAFAQKLYWSNGTSIQWANLDGSQPELVRGGFVDTPYIAADPAANTLYYTYGSPTPMIFRSDLNGDHPQALFTFDIHNYPRGLAVDHEDGKIYWPTSEGLSGGAGSIRRANLDGSGMEDIVTGLNYPYGMAFDYQAKKMYWINQGSLKIQRANLNGTNVEDVAALDNSSYAFSIAIDPIAQKLYWSDPGIQAINRANLDGSDIEKYQPVRSHFADSTIAIDAASRSIYWSDFLNFNDKLFYRGNLDGDANAVPIANDVATGITFTPEPSSCMIASVMWGALLLHRNRKTKPSSVAQTARPC